MFVTLEDPRAKIKGSRDPLGVQPVWSAFGRHLVCNLTTVTASVREFSVLLLARYACQRLFDDGRIEEDEAVPVFLRAEQLCAYSRHLVHGASNIRGISRIKRFLDDRNEIRISSDAPDQILTDQQMYGLWGLYTVSGRASGLIADDLCHLSELASTFVERAYVPRLGSQVDEFLKVALRGGTIPNRKNHKLLATIATILSPELTATECSFFGETLRDAKHASTDVVPGRQSRLASLINECWDPTEYVTRETVRAMTERAHDLDPSLAVRLMQVDRLEATIAPAEAAFEFILARHEQPIDTVASQLASVWTEAIPYVGAESETMFNEIETIAGAEFAQVVHRVDVSLATRDFVGLVHALLDWNRLVMDRRGAAPWVRMNEHGALDVRFAGEERMLPSAHTLGSYWRNSYFLDSLASITHQIAAGET